MATGGWGLWFCRRTWVARVNDLGGWQGAEAENEESSPCTWSPGWKGCLSGGPSLWGRVGTPPPGFPRRRLTWYRALISGCVPVTLRVSLYSLPPEVCFKTHWFCMPWCSWSPLVQDGALELQEGGSHQWLSKGAQRWPHGDCEQRPACTQATGRAGAKAP